MKKIALIFGTRPEAIKMASVVEGLKNHPQVSCSVCVTAQHREMLDQVLEVFNIVPDVDLNLMQSGQTLNELSSRSICGIDAFLDSESPDLVLVQGDTTTVLCASLACFHRHIPIGHIEAGLRTGDMSSPWPEEMNRVVTSRLATLHFAPTETARENLLQEGISDEVIFVTGNTVIDSLFKAVEKRKLNHPLIDGLPDNGDDIASIEASEFNVEAEEHAPVGVVYKPML